MRDIFHEHRGGFWTPARKRSLYLAFVLMALAIIVHVSAGQYSARHSIGAAPESDLFLDNLPIINLSFVIVGVAIAFWTFTWFLVAIKPRYILFSIKACALFIIVRAFFFNLTREGIYPGSFMPTAGNAGFGFYHLVGFEGNFFFSGHTAFPFLFALIFWNNRFWRWFFIIATVFFGAAVLLAHVHYSIDVFAAPFIMYGVYGIARRLFPGDYALMENSSNSSPQVARERRFDILEQ